MVFLNPAVLFGFLAASIPIIIHLLNLRKLKKIEFSTLTFLKELQKNKIKKVKIKQWLLLVLRTLIIIFLVLSFSRPTIKDDTVGVLGSAAKTTAIVIIDNTFSMSLITEKGSYLNQAKATAKNIISNLKEGDEITIIPSGNLSSQYTATSNFSKAKTEIDNIQISYISNSLHSSITKAAEMISKSDNFNKEIYLLTDFQAKGIYTIDKELSSFRELLNEQIRLYAFDFSGKEASNLSVTDFQPTNQIFLIGKTIGFEAIIKNTGNFNVTNSVVSLFINGEKKAIQNVNLNIGESKKIYFETVLNSKGLIEVFAELEDDEITADNKRYFAVFIPEEINLLLLYDEPEDSYFIKSALINNDSINLIKITEKPLSQITGLNLNNYNTIILIGSEQITNYEGLKNYLALGKNLIIFPAAKSTLAKFKLLTQNLSISSPSENKGGLTNKTGYNFGTVDYLHPLFTDLFIAGKKPQIQSPDIFYYFKLSTGINGRAIIEMDDKSPFLLEYSLKEGKVFVFNSAPSVLWSDLMFKGIFAPLVNRSVYYLAVKFNTNNNVIAGNPLFIGKGDNAFGKIDVNKPENNSEVISLDTLQGNSHLIYKNSETIGVYKFLSNSKLLDYAVVNFNPTESELIYSDKTDFEDYLKKINFKGSHFIINASDNYLETIYQSRFGAELWRLFLIIALVLAIIEMTISKSVKKDLTSIG